jgi:hypothetical protein
LQPRSEIRDVQVIETMVARDGVEPPTPAFSGLDAADLISLIPLSLSPL